MKPLLLLPVMLLGMLPASATTRQWTNTLGGSWFAPADWSPNGVPTGIDVANITLNGTYSVNILTGAVAVATLNLGGASGTQTLLNGTVNNLAITNAGNILANGVLAITNGGLQGNVTIQPGGALQLSGSTTKNVYQLTLNNQGTVTWSGGQLNGGSTPTTVINNSGLWQATSDSALVQAFGGPPMVWTNSGILVKNGGSGVSQINSFDFFNLPGGVINALTGTLSFTGYTNSVVGGSLTSTAPGVVNLAGGTWTDAGGSASGSGVNEFSGGIFNLRTNIIPGLLLTGGNVFVTGSTFQQGGAITNLTLDGAQLGGINQVGSGKLTINSGGVVGLLNILPAGQLALATAATKNVYQLTLNNQGTVTWSGGQLNGGSTPTTVINNSGLWQATSDSALVQAFGGPPMVWTNSGILVKNGGSGVSQINSFDFFNLPAGIIEADTGTLQLPTGFTNSTGTLKLNGGTLAANGTLGFNGGTLEGNGTLGSGALTGGLITPGLSGPGLLQFNSGLNLSSNATVILSGTGTLPGTQYDQLSVTGTVVLSNATLQVTSLPPVAGGTEFTLILNDGVDAVGGIFNGLPENSLINVSGQSFHIHYAGGSGNDVTLVRDGSPARAQLMSAGGLTNGVLRFTGSGAPSGIYGVQATTNFILWTNIGFTTGDLSGKFIFTDSNAFHFTYRFYRTTN
jgi:hypothetical protein